MKKIVPILSFLMLTVHDLKADTLPTGFRIQNKNDTASFPLNVYTSIDLAYYLNKPVNTFLANLDIVAPGYLLSTIYSQDNIRRAARINIYYAGNITYVITVKDFQFF